MDKKRKKTQRGSDTRAQASVDFLIGFSIFAVTLLFVLQMVSGSVVSVGPDSESRDTLAERSGALLIANWSNSAGLETGMVDNDSAKTFLGQSDDDVADDLNLPRENSYNVTVENVLTDDRVVVDGTELAAGPEIPNRTVSGISGDRRIVYMVGEEEMVRVEVRIW